MGFTDTAALEGILRDAFVRRGSFMQRLVDERTDCYRLLHGSQEGLAGVTLDRYGDLTLLQSFHSALPDDAVAQIEKISQVLLPQSAFVYNDRSATGSRVRNRLGAQAALAAQSLRIVSEHGVRFHLKARHRGHDPWLFLDLRPTRRAVMDEAHGKSMLNLFAYTCGVGVAAAAAGAHRVLNVDFARSALVVGADNAVLNGVGDRSTQLVSDVFPAVRQLGGTRQPPIMRRRRLPPFPHIDREQFDLVFLDPPPRSKSPFGVVDLEADYQSLLKPTLPTVADRGVLYCTNNMAGVDEATWHTSLRRCTDKHGRPIRSLDVIRPGEDFPSNDGHPPLKVARLQL